MFKLQNNIFGVWFFMAFLVLDEVVCDENVLFTFALAFVIQILYTKLHNVQTT
jgi:hypothetical protein